MMQQEPTIEQRRDALIADLQTSGIAITPTVLEAFRNVPRHLFLPGVYIDAVYRDVQIVARRDRHGVPVSASSRPSTLAAMLTALDVQPGQNILEIGTGSGYSAALIRALLGYEGTITSLETDDECIAGASTHLSRAGISGIDIVHQDGAEGFAERAPYDRIFVTAHVWDIPPAWIDQLAPEGLLICGLNIVGMQAGAALRKLADGSLQAEVLFPVDLLPLRGTASGPTKHLFVPGSALRLDFMDGVTLDEASLQTLLSDDQEMDQFPATIERNHLGMVGYYMLFHRPRGYEFVTYTVDEGQSAYGLTGIGWGIISRTSACFVPYGDQRVLHTFGSGDAAYDVQQVAVTWNERGRPDLSAVRLRVTPANQKAYLPDINGNPDADDMVRVVARPHYSYTMWMGPFAE